MDGGTALVIAVPAAILGAAGFGLATAAQQRATKEVDVAPTLSPKLITDLLRRPMWLIGLVATILAFTLQVLALAYGPIAIVQPLLVTGVVFAAGFSALMSRRRPDPLILLGALLCAAGLSAFLLLARPVPNGQPTSMDFSEGLPLAVALVAAVAACLIYAATSRHWTRVLALALATGILYGVTAGLVKAVTGQLRLGLTEPLHHFALYGVIVLGPIGFLLSQNTFQQGRVVSSAVAIITSVDPVVAVLIGTFWLGERVKSTPALLAGECLAAAVVIAGIVFITARGAHLLHEIDEDDGHALCSAGNPDPAPG
jgi:drug/metabolite transporter (DMT)-like permease